MNQHNRVVFIVVWAAVVAVGLCTITYAKGSRQAAAPAAWHTDSRFAAGEWKIEVQTPPCAGAKNLQVIFPKSAGAPLTIECDVMPVPTK